jgi:Ca2+-binding EF-hand superfamily protein
MSESVFRKEVLAVFEKYMKNNVRNLKKDQAMELFEKEFGLDHEQGEIMFNTFDKDKNGIMSIWEFQQLYMSIGNW